MASRTIIDGVDMIQGDTTDGKAFGYYDGYFINYSIGTDGKLKFSLEAEDGNDEIGGKSEVSKKVQDIIDVLESAEYSNLLSEIKSTL
jgi:hypothetical protein